MTEHNPSDESPSYFSSLTKSKKHALAMQHSNHFATSTVICPKKGETDEEDIYDEQHLTLSLIGPVATKKQLNNQIQKPY